MLRVGYVAGAWLLMSQLLWFVHTDVVFKVPDVVVRHAAGPKSVGSVRGNSSHRIEGVEEEGFLEGGETGFEEYFVEHDISTADAKRAAMALSLEEDEMSRVGCGTCSRSEAAYCVSRVLADHCCCERRMFPEPFPWLPHTCYMGPSRCRLVAPNCVAYSRIRDCCCRATLARRWKAILSGTVQLHAESFTMLALLVAVVLLGPGSEVY